MPTRTISAEHKARMAEGRRQSQVVERYLRQLETQLTKEKRPSAEEISEQLDRIETLLDAASGVERLALLQEREDMQRLGLELEPDDDGALEEQFVAVARSYGERKGISYSTWREFGVPKDVLEAAGIRRTRRPNRGSSGTSNGSRG